MEKWRVLLIWEVKKYVLNLLKKKKNDGNVSSNNDNKKKKKQNHAIAKNIVPIKLQANKQGWEKKTFIVHNRSIGGIQFGS